MRTARACNDRHVGSMCVIHALGSARASRLAPVPSARPDAQCSTDGTAFYAQLSQGNETIFVCLPRVTADATSDLTACPLRPFSQPTPTLSIDNTQQACVCPEAPRALGCPILLAARVLRLMTAEMLLLLLMMMAFV
jgi:hypothetical protein